MSIMTVVTADDMSKVKVEIRNVSVKYYTYDENISTQLYERFKYDLPNKIIFGSENIYTKEFKKLLYDNEYELDEDGKVIRIKDKVCYNSLEHAVETERDIYTLTVSGGQDQYKLTEILLANGYMISSKVDKSKVNISIHGKQY
ncbi:hypothetical protein ACQKNX_07500 [Lysinibacillus sp. NPDC093712]|uniref:hypothetical protein n=1 Tax=Lysinibacillus sp. NPDC093712 TaxID=3390579 RepID=UPI003D05E59D